MYNRSKTLKLNNYKVAFMPNPVDETLDDMKVYENKNPEYDLFLLCHMEFIGEF